MSNPITQPSRPAVVLGLTFLVIGLTFALPFQLVAAGGMDKFSDEIANVYACVAWAGWAHFLFAFRGQGGALARMRDEHKSGRLLLFAACVLLAIAALVGVRWAIGPALFGAIVWIYFIDHFLKAEQFFEGRNPSSPARWSTSSHALVAFTWLSLILLNVGDINSQPWTLWIISLVLGVAILVCGGWRNLHEGNIRSTLLALFFVGEALVWGTFSRYGGPVFLTGVYVVHIAAGSYFHYFGSYFAARARGAKDRFLGPLAVILVNLAVIGLGWLVARENSLSSLTPILGIQWFSLWVGVHLVSSDLFPLVKNLRRSHG